MYDFSINLTLPPRGRRERFDEVFILFSEGREKKFSFRNPIKLPPSPTFHLAECDGGYNFDEGLLQRAFAVYMPSTFIRRKLLANPGWKSPMTWYCQGQQQKNFTKGGQFAKIAIQWDFSRQSLFGKSYFRVWLVRVWCPYEKFIGSIIKTATSHHRIRCLFFVQWHIGGKSSPVIRLKQACDWLLTQVDKLPPFAEDDDDIVFPPRSPQGKKTS